MAYLFQHHLLLVLFGLVFLLAYWVLLSKIGGIWDDGWTDEDDSQP